MFLFNFNIEVRFELSFIRFFFHDIVPQKCNDKIMSDIQIQKKKIHIFFPSQVVKKPGPQFFFFFTRFRWPTFQKSNSPDKKLANSFDGGFKNRRIRKKICQKVPSLIHIHFPKSFKITNKPLSVSLSRSSNFNFIQRKLDSSSNKIEFKISQYWLTNYLAKKYCNFIFLSQHANICIYTTVQII